jgi:ankyrin repeat protein/uncharacterized protein with HEPN domain
MKHNNLLDALDILRIRRIISDLDTLINPNHDLDSFFMFKIANTDHLEDVYGARSDEGIGRSVYVSEFESISSAVGLLSRRSDSIRNEFTNFPWDDIEILPELFKSAISKQHFTEYDQIKAKCDADLGEFRVRLEQIILSCKVSRDEAFDLLGEPVADELKTLYAGQRFVHSQDLSPRGLANIRSLTAPECDKIQVKKILEIVKKIKGFDVEKTDGRESLVSACFMLGEYAKSISINTKTQNDKIPFKQLKEFRNIIHKLDILSDARKLFTVIEKEVDIFKNIQKYVTEILAPLFEGMIFPINQSLSDANSPLPSALHESKLDIRDVERILEIIGKAIPADQREKDEVLNKLDICRDILEGKLPIPINVTLEKIIAIIFKQEFGCEQNLQSNKGGIIQKALFANYDAMEDKRQRQEQIETELKFFKEQAAGFKAADYLPYKDPSQDVKFFKDFEDYFKHDANGTASTHSEEERKLYYIKEQTKMLLDSLEKVSSSIDMSSDYLAVRHKCEDTQFHYAHLFQLIIIGQAIQNLVGKDAFLEKAPPRLLVEFDHLKWVRNGLMHDLDIVEVGSQAAFFGNDMLNLNIREHGSKAYDSREYLNSLKSEIELVLERINGAGFDKTLKSTEQFDLFLLKELEKAYNANEHEIETLILKKLGVESERFGSDAHFRAEELLAKSRSIDLVHIHKNQEAILELANKHGIQIKGFFGKIVKWGLSHGSDSGIFVENDNEQGIALFKKEFATLIGYRMLVINRNHLEEFFEESPTKATEIDDFVSDTEANAFSKVMGGVEVYLAIKRQASLHEVEQLLQEDLNLDFVIEGYSIVQHACHAHARNLQIVKLLLEYGVNPDIQDKRGDTLAHYAAEENHVGALRLLHDKGADFSTKNRAGKTALDITVEHYTQNREVYEFLLSFSEQSVMEKMALAIKQEDIERLEVCLSSIDVEMLNIETKKFGLIAHIACAIGNIRIIEMLQKAGCDFSMVSEDGATALEEACEGDNANKYNSKDRVELIKYLIDKVKIPITPDTMHNALYCNNLKILKLLLDRGGDVNAESIMSPLLVIINQPRIDKHDIKVIKILLENGANILQHNGYVGNSLHLAAERGHEKVANILLKYAIENNQLEELLLPSPEKCWVCKGLNAYQIAQQYKHYKVMKILEQYFHGYDDRDELDNLQVEESCQSFLLESEENNNLSSIIDLIGVGDYLNESMVSLQPTPF